MDPMRGMKRGQSLMLGLGWLALASCTTSQLQTPQPDSAYLSDTAPSGQGAELQRCARLFVTVDSVIMEAGVQDMQTQRIAGFPYLRVNRFLSSFRNELDNREQTRFWAGQLRGLDHRARSLELANLPDAASLLDTLDMASEQALRDELANCGDTLLTADLADRERVNTLRERASVPDSYSTLARVAGVYPISSWFVGQGVSSLQSEIEDRFDEVAQSGLPDTVRYPPPETPSLDDAEIVAMIQETASSNPLGIPYLSDESRSRLFARFAPVWEIQTHSESDRFGAPQWSGAEVAGIDTGDPVVYRMLSFTRLEGEILPQLNYVIWFPERPREGPFDMLGGHLDGITLRVTLGTDGRPVMYDAMHNCGCYHMYFPPAEGLSPAPEAATADEPLLIPTRVEGRGRPVVKIETDTHYITGVETTMSAQASDSAYRFAHYDELRSLPLPGSGNRSLFEENGLVKGTTRRERWTLWPMGVLEPGAMRQWGHHAVAFIGRRHFDEPFLLEQYFESESRAEAAMLQETDLTGIRSLSAGRSGSGMPRLLRSNTRSAR